MVYLIAWILTVYAANLAITYLGMVPVGFGLLAPAGVYAAGLAFTLRDLTQERLGRRWIVVGVLIGAGLSAALSPSLAIASGVAFLVSELADFAVYTPLRHKSWVGAVTLSNTLGLVVDSILFLALAFGSLDFLAGQVVGKIEMTILAVAIIAGVRLVRSSDRRFWRASAAASLD